MKIFSIRYLWALVVICSGCAARPAVSPPQTTPVPAVLSARFGYQLALPDAGWRRIRAASLHPRADLALEHEGGDAVALVFAERANRMRLDDFVRQSRGYVRLVAGAGASWTSAETTRVLAGTERVPAWIIERQVERRRALRYYTLVTVVDGVGYNVLCWGSAHNQDLDLLCRDLLRGFQVRRDGTGPLDILSLASDGKN
ncbi:MAG: hypothetical protein RMK29_06890 [Myxococcales bacterium]|nr:hypothetical protein [Myxococcota bacterium]MDW8281419.1 hypothetical protein [Myxococcales bacterium]